MAYIQVQRTITVVREPLSEAAFELLARIRREIREEKALKMISQARRAA